MQATTDREAALRRYQRDMGLFSRDVIGYPLYRYQVEWAQYALDMIAERRNEVLVVEQPRQSGKNETSAQLEVAVLARHGAKGGELVKCAPTFKPQIVNSRLRFATRAEMAAERLPFLKVRASMGYMYRLGRAGITFLSADPGASVVGATASLALEVDEAQDVDAGKFDKDFSPMRASTAAPMIQYGTTWTNDTLLATTKRDILEGRLPGKVFRVQPELVGEENAAYWLYVEGEVRRLGRQHPLIRTQYFLEELENRGRLFGETQLRQMMGDHGHKEQRESESIIVAGLDWAGADEDSGDISSLMRESKRDSVALSVGAVMFVKETDGLWVPQVRALARYEWTNVHPLSIKATLYDILQRKWRVNLVHSDGTGIGATGTLELAKALDAGTGKRVKAVVFDGAWRTHTDLAFQLISLVNGSRFLDYKAQGFDPIGTAQQEQPDKSSVHRHVWWQRGHARMEAKANQRVRVYVPENEGHDDLLMADMLMVDAAMALQPVAPVGAAKKRTPIG
jgi:hypothetical protein